MKRLKGFEFRTFLMIIFKWHHGSEGINVMNFDLDEGEKITISVSLVNHG